MNWTEAAEGIYRSIGDRILSAPIRAALNEESSMIWVACSGGADSLLALLYFSAWARCKDGPGSKNLGCLHFNHALRGIDSENDQRFLTQVCSKLQVEFVTSRAQWNRPVDTLSEEDAREARLDFFRRAIARKGERRGLIITGHQSDDIAETLLMRLSRGSGVRGLASPKTISAPDGDSFRFLRPFLGFSRQQIQSLLREAGVDWRTDSSNQSTRFYRNRLRREVIPAWESASDRPIRRGVERARELLEEDSVALESLANRFWDETWDAVEQGLGYAAVRKLPRGVQRRLILRVGGQTQVRSGDLKASLVDAVLDRIARGEDFSYPISINGVLEGKEGWIRLKIRLAPLRSDWLGFKIPFGCFGFLPTGNRVGVEVLEIDREFMDRLKQEGNDDRFSVFLRLTEKHSRFVEVRPPQRNDAFRPHGRSSKRGIRELSNKRKGIWESNKPVLLWENEIAWFPGLPPAASMLLGEKDQYALRLTYEA